MLHQLSKYVMLFTYSELSLQDHNGFGNILEPPEVRYTNHWH